MKIVKRFRDWLFVNEIQVTWNGHKVTMDANDVQFYHEDFNPITAEYEPHYCTYKYADKYRISKIIMNEEGVKVYVR